jgi:HAD superfamily hydrolase (TIGR01509 family)
MLQAVIFDLNGIFVQAPKLGARLQEDFNVDPEIFKPKLREIMQKVRTPGAGNAFQYWQPVLAEWNINLSEREFWEYWFGAEKISDRMVLFAKELKQKGVKIFILSNNFRERADYYGHYPWIGEVADKVYFSFTTGFVKPDTRAWELILSENGLSAEGCVYFDDKKKNLAASESVGIRAFLFTDEEDLEKKVKNLL